ncbi:MAG: DUF4013 domain-containing protein [candidate division KSB1 bacterium]|nr:DUF4013 domain-containing protein [candidate division KSB1 bacterium]MDZ7304234.1 DUF4013 domain-containing protein [candidate division KSB1 bacterium]MDZ7311709.1 DUF4013 domain-containing protein [candidate division KSB1 bacterium]
MNYSEALSFIFQDKDWLKKIALGGLLVFIAAFTGIFFFVGFFAMGYYVRVLRHVVNGEEKILTDWKDWGNLFAEGLMAAIVSLVYFLIIGGLCAFVIVNIATAHGLAGIEKGIAITSVAILTFLGLIILINASLTLFVKTNDFASAFSPSAISNLLKNNFSNYLTIAIFTSILGAILFLAGMGIFSPFTNFWGLMVQAHLFGQCAKETDKSAATVQSA